MKELFNPPVPASQEPAGQLFIKEKKLIEYAAEDPLYVLQEVFAFEKLDFIREFCRDWFYIAIINNDSTYSDGDQRAGLIAFNQQLSLALEALYVILQQQQPANKPVPYNQTLSPQQTADPLAVINAFYCQFPIEHVRRELWDWLEAGISYPGNYPDTVNEAEILFTYERILCLVEAGWQWILFTRKSVSL